MRERTNTDWPSLFNNFNVYELSAVPFIDYFAPLEAYLDSTINLEQKYVPPTTTTPKPTTAKPKPKKAKKLISKNANNKESDENVQNEEPAVPRHILEDREETPNHVMEHITVFIGVGLLVAVAAIIGYVIVSKKLKRRRRANNRRFET